ncbi:MAG: hypothetical protein H0X07_00150 [Gemmatimonadales bacterium]|nr:hypothetical protein [Gemmatimonadales bacterium]
MGQRIGRVFIQGVELLEYDDDGNIVGSQMTSQAVLHYPHAQQLASLLGEIQKRISDGEKLQG